MLGGREARREHLIGAVAWSAWGATVGTAAVVRNRVFAIFVAVLLGASTASWTALFAGAPDTVLHPAAALHLTTVLHFLTLSRPRLRPLWFRLFISIPGLGFLAGNLLAIPWAAVSAVGWPPHGWWIPYVLALVGVVQSLVGSVETARLTLDRSDQGSLGRVDGHEIGDESLDDGQHLRVVQITDPHLGPFMPVSRLRAICERSVALDPDLVVITGDILTMESQADVEAVSAAFEPLTALPERVFACLGNHDHEARATVEEAIARIGGRLLVDEMETVTTRVGPVEIAGADYLFRGRAEQLGSLFARLGQRGELPRLLLLHDPGAFKHVPDGAADLTLSGHTHGGQLGLRSLGIPWTVVSAAGLVPDQGLWAQGRNRLYVHRGTGHYGFPVRLGVASEESLLVVRFDGEGGSGPVHRQRPRE